MFAQNQQKRCNAHLFGVYLQTEIVFVCVKGAFMNNYPEKYSVEELTTGIREDETRQCFTCIQCEKSFPFGYIYEVEGQLMDARKRALVHVEKRHGGMFHSLISLGKEVTGISEVQKSVLESLYAGESDAVIAGKLGGKSESTVRNHRFKLKRRKTEAKLFLSIMNLLEKQEAVPMEEKIVQFHDNIPIKDDRIVITEREESSTIAKYFDGDLLRSFPKKQKIKLIILKKIALQFKQGVDYSELQVNEILMPIFPDYVEIRRYLIDYAFLTRNSDGSIYRLNEQIGQ